MQHYAERDIWGDLRPGTEIPSGLEENLRFTSYRYDPVIGKYFAQARFYDSANGRMLSKDPVKRGLNSYRYCDNDPADYVDPTGEIAHILWGIGLGGAFGFGGGFLSSAVSQKASGGEIDWKEALGSGINGLITGATQGGLLASGAGIPAALFANTLAGTAGSAAEQYIGSGKIDARKSITSGLNNAVSNAIYGTRPLGSMKEAFGRGVGAGAATSALNYISDTLGEKTLHSRMGMGLLSGMTGAAFSPYNFLRNPRRGCGSASPFVPSLGYSSARGYQYDLPKIESGSQSQSKRFSFKDLLLEMVIGGVTGGLSSAAFYGAGKGIERLIDGLRPKSTGKDIGYMKNNSDPMRDALGSGRKSNPEEWNSIIQNLEKSGVEMRYREGNMAYAPGMTEGSPGQLVIDPNASLSALKHEYRHFLDAQAEGFPSFGKQMFEDPKARVIKELRAYMVEIKEADRLGLKEISEQLFENYRKERAWIVNQYMTFGGE